MKHKKNPKAILLWSILTSAVMAGLLAQAEQIETTGAPGPPSATTSISGKQLPTPPPPEMAMRNNRTSE